jgi:transposase-like protein
MASQKSNLFPEHLEVEDGDPESDEEIESFAKSKVECVCPGCGKMHVLKMRWIGRGIPRKFCHNCRDRETPLDDEI